MLTQDWHRPISRYRLEDIRSTKMSHWCDDENIYEMRLEELIHHLKKSHANYTCTQCTDKNHYRLDQLVFHRQFSCPLSKYRCNFCERIVIRKDIDLHKCNQKIIDENKLLKEENKLFTDETKLLHE